MRYTRLLHALILTLTILGLWVAGRQEYINAAGLFAYAGLISFIQGLASPSN